MDNTQTAKATDKTATESKETTADNQAKLSNQVQDYAKHAHNHGCRDKAAGSPRSEKQAHGEQGAERWEKRSHEEAGNQRSEMVLRKGAAGFPPKVELVGHKGKPEGCVTVEEGRPKRVPGTDLTVQKSVTVCER